MNRKPRIETVMFLHSPKIPDEPIFPFKTLKTPQSNFHSGCLCQEDLPHPFPNDGGCRLVTLESGD